MRAIGVQAIAPAFGVVLGAGQLARGEVVSGLLFLVPCAFGFAWLAWDYGRSRRMAGDSGRARLGLLALVAVLVLVTTACYPFDARPRTVGYWQPHTWEPPKGLTYHEGGNIGDDCQSDLLATGGVAVGTLLSAPTGIVFVVGTWTTGLGVATTLQDCLATYRYKVQTDEEAHAIISACLWRYPGEPIPSDCAVNAAIVFEAAQKAQADWLWSHVRFF